MLEWIKAKLRDHFGFSRTEVYGTLVLLWIMSIVLCIPLGLRWYYNTYPQDNHAQDVALLEKTLKALAASHKVAAQKLPQSIQATQSALSSKATKQASASSKSIQPFDINTANETQLKRIAGIGPTLSARIISFRDKLGGFVTTQQYEAIYGLSPIVAQRLCKQTYISKKFQPRAININTASVKLLATHPYLNYQQAKSIVQYRKQHGPFQRTAELANLVLMDEDTLRKIRPYLALQ